MSRSFVCLALFVAACGGAAPARSTTVAPENRSIKLLDWSARDASAPMWSASARRVELIVTPGWTANEHLLWVVEDASKINLVYRVGGEQTASLDDAAAKLAQEAQSQLVTWALDGAQGIIKTPPPPPPPGPVGFPGDLIEAVIGYAADLEAANARFAGAADARQ